MSHRRKTILVIEDELDLREILLAQFVSQGWGVLFSLTFPEIKAMIADSDAILMDWTIPGLDSRMVYQYARKHRPCLVYSGDLDCPIKGFVEKPFDLKSLLQKCEAVIDRARRGLDLFVGNKVESRVSPEWGSGEIYDMEDDVCWVKFVRPPRKPIELQKEKPTHLSLTRVLSKNLRRLEI